MHPRLVGAWLFLILPLLSSYVAGEDVTVHHTPKTDGILPHSFSAHTPQVELYCNITGPCHPCKKAHLDSDACRATGHAEKLTCVANRTEGYQLALHIRRRIDKAGPPLHISRSCPAPSNAGAPASSSSSSAAADRSTAEATPAPQPGDADAASSAAGDDSNGDKAKPRQAYFPEARRAGVGGLNVLYFELVMLLVLSGALPAVYFRKRRYVRL